MMDPMMWGKWRPWLALAGPLIAVAVVTAAPAGVKAGAVPWPKWVIAALIAAASVLVASWTPLLKARVEALAARTTRNTQREAQAESALRQLPTRKGKFPFVEEVTDRRLLGIHEAIPLPADTSTELELSAELPCYVPRDIDSDLRTALQAQSKSGGFMLLVGPAAAGKTRCAYEALRTVLPRWRFVMGDASTLNELFASGHELRKSVVWLDEIQRFLSGPDRLTAMTISRLLADTAHPVILVGTIWPDTYDRLRGVGSEKQKDNSEGFDNNSSEVLRLAHRFTLGAMSDGEWARAEELSSTDPRIAQAIAHRRHGDLTQLLSGAPELVYRWEHADDAFGKAVISAAVAARRCNHPEPIPYQVLKVLTEEYLTGLERAEITSDTWFIRALDWACRPVQNSGGIAPLHAYAEAIGVPVGYEVSDVLVHHSTISNSGMLSDITASFWARLIGQATVPACFNIGYAAYDTGLYEQARSAWERVCDAGNTPAFETGVSAAMFNLGALSQNEGDAEAARSWYTHAAERGNTRAMTNLGALLVEEGNTDDARTWYTRAAELGETGAMNNLGALLANEDAEAARNWYTRAAESGDVAAMFNLGNLSRKQGDTEAARNWYTHVAETGVTAGRILGTLSEKEGHAEAARTWLTHEGETGVSAAMFNLGVMSQDEGDAEAARNWYTRAAESGHIAAMINLGTLSAEEGNTDDARTWYTCAAEAGDTRAMINLGALLAEGGNIDDARTWYTLAAETRDTAAMINLGNLAWEVDDAEAARNWYTRAAESGDTRAMNNLGALLAAEEGDIEDAGMWWTRAAETGNTAAMTNLGKLSQMKGDAESAHTWWTRAAESGDTLAADLLAALRKQEK